jgi:CubicO group peptidase (beta-lactamase class C family)
MLEFYPEFQDQIADLRKAEITIRHLLQMRAGYPWEESSGELFNILYSGMRASDLVRVPLTKDPGAGFQYSNMTSNLLAIIVARACDTDLRTFADEHLFSLLHADVGEWWIDQDGYYYGMSGIHLTAREMAKFGLLYLNEGEYRGTQVLPADWVRESLQSYSDVVYFTGGRKKGCCFDELGYGYQWWSAEAGGHRFSYAAGHGGQHIVLLDDLDMVIVTTAYPFHGDHGGDAWKHEKAITNLVGRFIASLPGE